MQEKNKQTRNRTCDTHHSSAILVAEDPPDGVADSDGKKHNLRPEGKMVTSSNFHQHSRGVGFLTVDMRAT